MLVVSVLEFYTAEINAAFMALRARCRWLKSCFHVDVSASNHSFFIQFMACNLQNAFITEQPAGWIYKIDTFFFTSVNAGSFTPFCRRLNTFHNSFFLHFYIGWKSLQSWRMLSFLVQSHSSPIYVAAVFLAENNSFSIHSSNFGLKWCFIALNAKLWYVLNINSKHT